VPKRDGGDQAAAASCSPEALSVYVEVARTHYTGEEQRWSAAQDRAKVIFAVAALVASLMFARVDWAASQVRSGWQWWTWLSAVFVGAALLLVALVISAKVFSPRGGWGLESPDVALQKLARIPADQVQQYLGEAYASTAKKNAVINDRQLRLMKYATWMVISSVGVALVQLLFVLVVSAR